jgi:hypothetical protein
LPFERTGAGPPTECRVPAVERWEAGTEEP